MVLGAGAVANPARFKWIRHHNTLFVQHGYPVRATNPATASFNFGNGSVGKKHNAVDVPVAIAGLREMATTFFGRGGYATPSAGTEAGLRAFFRVRAQGFGMGPLDWEACSFELARTLVDAASRDLADSQLSPEEKSRAMRLVMGFQRTKKAIRVVGAARISVVAQRATPCPHAKDLARKRRAWLRRIWFAPPELSAEDRHKWWDLIATAGLSGRAAEEQLEKLVKKRRGILIFAPSDFAELGKDQLRIATEYPQPNRLLGQLWGAVKVAGGAGDLAERPCPSTYVLQDWDAYQLANAISAHSAKDSEIDRTPSSYA